MAPTPAIHPTAIIGSAPEHRDHTGIGYPPFIHPTARINNLCTVDAGMAAPTHIGARTWLLCKVHVGHDAMIGDDCELAPGTVVGGHAVLGNGVRCGIGVMVRPGVTIGDGARLGAGAVVVSDVPAGQVWIGNPARPMRCKVCKGRGWTTEPPGRSTFFTPSRPCPANCAASKLHADAQDKSLPVDSMGP